MTIYPTSFNYKDKVLDAAANNGDSIDITSTISGDTVRFKPLLKSFSDNHNSTFQAESVFGRMDDLMAYQSTKRSISINFDVPSYSQEEAADNLEKVNLIKAWMYPSYNRGSAITIKKAPLFRIKYMNLIYNSANASGLLGTLDAFAFSPDLGEGSYVLNGIVIPKTFSVSLNLKVLHEFKLENSMSNYPYKLGKPANTPTAAVSGPTARETK